MQKSFEKLNQYTEEEAQEEALKMQEKIRLGVSDYKSAEKILEKEKLNQKILESVKDTLVKYNMLEDGERVLLALSGGKDSITTMLALKELGYDVLPAIVDIGYHDFDAKAIKEYADSLMGKDVTQILKVRDDNFKKRLPLKIVKKIESNVKELDKIDFNKDQTASPCSACYNTKMMALENLPEIFEAGAKKENIKTIVFGHNSTDALCSLLKESLMYEDCRRQAGIPKTETPASLANYDIKYDFDRFRKMCEEISIEDVLQITQELVDKLHYTTDEAPVEYRYDENGNVKAKIVRPLFNIFEHTIKQYRDLSELKVQSSGCAHGGFVKGILQGTPRELVLEYIINRILSEKSQKDAENILNELMNHVRSGIKEDGTLKWPRIRKERTKTIGKNYKTNTQEKN